jgi:radical SAM protein with 4Fe4S-binding SPASM domain
MQELLLKARKMIPMPVKKKLYFAQVAGKVLRRHPRGYQNYLLSMFSEKLRLPRAYGKPVSITLEPSNICNLRCPVCETGSHILGRTSSVMSYENFVKIMNKVGPGANHLMFYYMGEPFLNKDAYRMIRYARDMGLYVTTCTNGDYVDPEALYDSGINHVSFQIGGITQETHQVYRRNSDLLKVLRNLQSYLIIINDRGKKANEHEVELGLIVMRQNEAEIEGFLRLGQELKVKPTLISPCVRTSEQAREFLPKADAYWLYDREMLENHDQLVIKRVVPRNSCPWLYYAITIQVDGNAVPCCRDPQGKYVMGNLLSEPLEKVWNSPKFRELRYLFSRGKDHQLSLCNLCPGEGPPELK